MKKPKPITIPELVKALGVPAISEGTGCDPLRPYQWAKGCLPGAKYMKALADLATRNGYTLTIPGGAR